MSEHGSDEQCDENVGYYTRSKRRRLNTDDGDAGNQIMQLSLEVLTEILEKLPYEVLGMYKIQVKLFHFTKSYLYI